MHTQAYDEANPAPVDLEGETGTVVDPEARSSEELRLLIIGVGVGAAIAATFLVYIVLSAAGLLT